MRYVLIALGIVFTVIAFTGAVLPLLPTTPFLILAAICFTNSSRKFKIWLESTQIYKNYVENLKKYKGYTMKRQGLSLTLLPNIQYPPNRFTLEITS